MEHHEGNYRLNTSQHQAGGADMRNASRSQPVLICPNSPPTPNAAFRSISFPETSLAAPPLLPAGLTRLTATPATKAAMYSAQDDSLPLSMAQKKEAVGAIPVVPSFHIMERTAIQISQDTLTISNLLDRVLHYLKLHSISYECEADTGCFECTSPNTIEFAVQLWRGRVNNNNSNDKQLWVEVQRRQGCAIAMNAIRRSLLRHVKGSEPEPPAVAAGHRRPISEADTHAHLQNTGSNKRHRSLSPHSARLSCQEALAITLRLLDSSNPAQQKMGLETLAVLTDARLVSPEDATTSSRALVLGEGPAGPPLQQRLASILRQVQPTLAGSGFGHDSYTLGIFYHILLHAIANALEQVYHRDSASSTAAPPPRMDLNAPFWQLAAACLMVTLEHAMRKPHEATLAAKCLRYLLPAKTGTNDPLHIPVLHTALRKNYELGQASNLCLEEESRKTLGFLLQKR